MSTLARHSKTDTDDDGGFILLGDHDHYTSNATSSSADQHAAVGHSNVERSEKILQHTLMDAVADGTISEYAAFCGLLPDDIERLSEKYADAKLLVRLRTARGDGRAFMSVENIIRWSESRDTIIADLRLWNYGDIRDIFPVALNDGK